MNETNLASALMLAQSEFPAIPHDCTNPHFKSKYTSLDALINGTRQVLAKHGLVVVQLMGDSEPQTIALITQLWHAPTNTCLESKCVLPLDKNNAQGAGSAITYARRYGYAAMLGIVSESDDDGNAASTKAKPKAEPVDRNGTTPKDWLMSILTTKAQRDKWTATAEKLGMKPVEAAEKAMNAGVRDAGELFDWAALTTPVVVE